MIKVTVYRRSADQTLKGLRIHGHAGYAEYGSDIICAGVSALATNLVNSIEAFTKDEIVTHVDEEIGLLEFKFRHIPSHDAILLTDACILGIETIQKENAEYIRLIFKEV